MLVKELGGCLYMGWSCCFEWIFVGFGRLGTCREPYNEIQHCFYISKIHHCPLRALSSLLPEHSPHHHHHHPYRDNGKTITLPGPDSANKRNSNASPQSLHQPAQTNTIFCHHDIHPTIARLSK